MYMENYIKKPHPPIYEFSQIKIVGFILVTFVLFVGAVAHWRNWVLADGTPIVIFGLIYLEIIVLLIITYSPMTSSFEISSEVYHPDLMSNQEYKSMNRRYLLANQITNRLISQSSEKAKTICKKLSAILYAQMKLRWISWLKIVFGSATKTVVEPSNGKNNVVEAFNHIYAIFKSDFNAIQKALTDKEDDLETDSEIKNKKNDSEDSEASDSKIKELERKKDIIEKVTEFESKRHSENDKKKDDLIMDKKTVMCHSKTERSHEIAKITAQIKTFLTIMKDSKPTIAKIKAENAKWKSVSTKLNVQSSIIKVEAAIIKVESAKIKAENAKLKFEAATMKEALEIILESTNAA